MRTTGVQIKKRIKFILSLQKMATVDVMSVSSGDSVDCKPSKAEILRGFVAEKLTAAAQEILAVVERTVAGYEEEASGLRQEIDRQRRQLEVLLQPQVTLWRIDDQFPVCEPAAGGGAEYPEEDEKYKYEPNVEDWGSWDVLGPIEEDEGEDDGEESAEEPVQSTSLDQEDLRDPDHQIPNTKAQAVKRKRRRRGPLNLRVCLLEDSQTDVLTKCASKTPVHKLRCPRGMQEPEFLDLLRSTFPQLTEWFDAFTTDASKKLTPLKLQTLTPEEIQRSIKSTGKGRSALYIRAKRARNSLTSPEQPPPVQIKEEATNDTRHDENMPHTSSVEDVESNKADRLSSNWRWQQQRETEEEGAQRGTSEGFSALYSARPAAESEGDNGDDDDVEEDDKDDNWKPDTNDEEAREGEAEPNSLQTEQRGERPGVKTERRKQSSPKASAENSDAPLSCKVCQALRGSTRMLIKHAWSHVDDPERLCGVCGEHSESAEELRNHLQGHQKTHSCTICGKSFLTFISLERHAGLHTGESPYKCDICHKVYMYKSSLKIHQWEHVEDKPYKCDVCSRSFPFKQRLMIHSRIHTGEKPYSCDVCGTSLRDFRSLAQHKLGHTGEKRYGCQVCGKRFLTPGKVKQHEKIHRDRDRAHLCDVCCKTFHTRGQLKAHLMTHSEEKIICSECGKGLSSPGALRRHMMIHTGQRPYECSECGQTFNGRSILQAHLKIHSGVKQFVCGVCGKACARKESLKVHMRIHSGEKPYMCSVCDKAFTQSHCLTIHMKSHQGEEGSAVGELKD